MKPLKVNAEYRALVPRPSPEDFKALEEDMIAKGEATEPIIINKNGEILDGHTRFQIAQRHGLYFETVQKDFESPEAERRYVVEVNLYRRHLSPFQKVCLAQPLEESIAAEAGIRMRAGTLISDEERVHTSEVIAKRIGVSRATYDRAKKVRDHANVNIKEMVLSGEMSIAKAYSLIMPKLEKPTPTLPVGQFNVIYADPPWEYRFSETYSRSIPAHYQDMSLDEIKNLEVNGKKITDSFAENSILFLWATNPKLEEALQVVKAWGFDYRTNLVWVKDKIGMGYWVRGQHELLLIAVKGNYPTPEPELRRSSLLEAPRMEHSEKPKEVYEIIESYFPNGKYLELFSRNQRKGWTMWGLEAPENKEPIETDLMNCVEPMEAESS